MRFFKNFTVASVALLVGGMLWMSRAVAQETPTGTTVTSVGAPDGGAGKKLEPSETRKRSKFTYQLDERPDPFYSFIAKEEKERAKKPDDSIEVPDETKLTGMQRFEPGQLRLVAVMEVQGSKIAMAEDMAGKGYVLRENMLIGKYGKIIRIAEDGKVIIKETLRTRAGREITNDIVMNLKKEEDKKP